MSGYCYCACRDCFEIAISNDDEPAMCWECEEAGCEGECQREDAYGGEEDMMEIIDRAGNGMHYHGIGHVGSGYDAQVARGTYGGLYGRLYDIRARTWSEWTELGDWARDTDSPAAVIAQRGRIE